MKTYIKAISKNGKMKITGKGKTVEHLDMVALILSRMIIQKTVANNEDALLGYIKNQMQSFKKILQPTEKGGGSDA